MNELSERQLEIVRATVSLISDEGVHNFSIRKLARRVGVTEPAIYRHFENKDDLMMKLATYIVRNWHEMLDEFPVRRLTVIDQVHLIFEEVMRYLQENRAFAKTLISADLFAAESGMTAILLQLKSEGLIRFSELLSAGQAAGEIRSDLDVFRIAKIFFGSVWWLVTDWLSKQSENEPLAEWNEVWECLITLLEKQ